MGRFVGRGRGGHRSTRVLAVIAGAAVGLIAVQGALGADVSVSWAAAAAGNWNVTGNWNPAIVPNNGVDNYLVTIAQTGTPYLVTLDIAPTIKDFIVTGPDATVELQTNLLTMTRDMTLTNTRIQSTARAGQLNVAGQVRLNTVHFHETRLVSNGPLIFEGSGTNDICDTEIDHEGSAMTWNDNGTITVDDGSIGARLINGTPSTFTITGDGTMLYSIGPVGTFENRGTTRKNGGTGITFIDGVIVDNTGTIETQTGTLKMNTVNQYNSGTQKLTGGKWSVLTNSTLDFMTQTITKNGADVTLSGTGSVFAAINGLSENSTGGKFTITSGRNFTTTGAFTNNGTIKIGTGSLFRVAAGQTMTKGAGSVLDIAGTLQEDGGPIGSLQTSKIVLRAGGQFINQASADRLAGLTDISLGGHFQTIGRNYTFGSLNLGSGGTLSIGDSGTGNSSTVTVTGSLVYQTGSILNIINGNIVVTGTMVQRGALRGGGTVSGNVQSQGTIAPGASPGTLTIDGDLHIDTDSIYECELLNSSSGNFDVLNVTGGAVFGTGGIGGTFNLTLLPGFHASLGEFFDVMQFRTGQGTFASINGLSTDDYGFVSQMLEDRFRITVVRIPAPGAMGVFGLAGLLAARRRR